MDKIPSLQHVPAKTIPNVAEVFEMMGFDLQDYRVPESFRHAQCRLISEFENICVIGGGTYGTIYKAKEIKTKKILAVKKWKVETSQGLPINSIREITILKSLIHENIISTFGIAVGNSFQNTCILLEYCPYELIKVLDDEEAYSLLDQSQIKNIMMQLFCGLDYMHGHFVLHRDLTPSNILFSSTGILKIIDFGESCIFSAENEEKSPNKGTCWYRSPELLFGSTTYSSSIDIWAAGCVMGELLLKKPLYPGDSDVDVISLIVNMLGTPNGETWPGLSTLEIMENYELCLQPDNKLKSHFTGHSDGCIDLLHKLLLYNPQKRSTAEECLKHSYFLEERPKACDFSTLLITLRRPDMI